MHHRVANFKIGNRNPIVLSSAEHSLVTTAPKGFEEVTIQRLSGRPQTSLNYNQHDIVGSPEARLPQIAVDIRPTRTLSKPDGICSSGVGQHLATALHRHLAV